MEFRFFGREGSSYLISYCNLVIINDRGKEGRECNYNKRNIYPWSCDRYSVTVIQLNFTTGNIWFSSFLVSCNPQSPDQQYNAVYKDINLGKRWSAGGSSLHLWLNYKRNTKQVYGVYLS